MTEQGFKSKMENYSQLSWNQLILQRANAPLAQRRKLKPIKLPLFRLVLFRCFATIKIQIHTKKHVTQHFTLPNRHWMHL